MTPAKVVSSNKYKYKLQESDFSTLPALGDDLSAWSDWNGTDEITATNGYYIAVAETEANNTCEKVGKRQVSSRVQSTITYMDGADELTGLSPATYLEGIGATLPADVSKSGYTFNGWYDNAGLTGNAVTEIGTNATGNKTFYASFTQNGETYTDTTNDIELTITTNPQTGVKSFTMDWSGDEYTGTAYSSVPTEQGVNVEYFLEYYDNGALVYALARMSGASNDTINLENGIAICNIASYSNNTKTYVPIEATEHKGSYEFEINAVANAVNNQVIFDGSVYNFGQVSLADGVYTFNLDDNIYIGEIIYAGSNLSNLTINSLTTQMIGITYGQNEDFINYLIWGTSRYRLSIPSEGSGTFTRTDPNISDINKLSGTYTIVEDEQTGGATFTLTYLDATTDAFLVSYDEEDKQIVEHITQ